MKSGPYVTYRQDIIKDLIKNICPEHSLGVEVGVDKGHSARAILELKNVDKVYLVDPYDFNISCESERKKRRKLRRSKRHFSKAREKIWPFLCRRYEFMLMKSEEASNLINEKLDFVFIDGNHSYEFVMKDLNSWFGKLKSRSLFFGHDWTDESMKEEEEDPFPGVRKAVTEFMAKNRDAIEIGVFEKYNFTHKYVVWDTAHVNQTEPFQVQDNFWWIIKK